MILLILVTVFSDCTSNRGMDHNVKHPYLNKIRALHVIISRRVGHLVEFSLLTLHALGSSCSGGKDCPVPCNDTRNALAMGNVLARQFASSLMVLHCMCTRPNYEYGATLPSYSRRVLYLPQYPNVRYLLYSLPCVVTAHHHRCGSQRYTFIYKQGTRSDCFYAEKGRAPGRIEPTHATRSRQSVLSREMDAPFGKPNS